MIVPVGHHISIKAKDKQGSYTYTVCIYIAICMHILYNAISHCDHHAIRAMPTYLCTKFGLYTFEIQLIIT